MRKQQECKMICSTKAYAHGTSLQISSSTTIIFGEQNNYVYHREKTSMDFRANKRRITNKKIIIMDPKVDKKKSKLLRIGTQLLPSHTSEQGCARALVNTPNATCLV